MKYDGIGFNGEHLSTFSKPDFVKEVKHFFKDDPKAKEKIDELYRLIRAKYNPNKPNGEAPAEDPAEDKPKNEEPQ